MRWLKERPLGFGRIGFLPFSIDILVDVDVLVGRVQVPWSKSSVRKLVRVFLSKPAGDLERDAVTLRNL